MLTDQRGIAHPCEWRHRLSILLQTLMESNVVGSGARANRPPTLSLEYLPSMQNSARMGGDSEGPIEYSRS